MISALPSWSVLPVLLLFLFAMPLLTLVHAGLALGGKNGPASRFLLLGLLPSFYAVTVLAMSGYGDEWLLLFRPPLIYWPWISGFVSQTWYLWPAFLACLVFGAEMGRRGHVPKPLIRLTIAAVYLGAFWAGYLMLESLGRS